ncbi:Calcium-binding mitochondrial carrier protein SCaMC-1 [Porphyridium purpureum]|uniref:Calcium-binding mitochondrial carrier protein SCaMC-1 n=1 Tax=Porphyridium purpureum TaxID=35688 RepID=A0A5J4Z9R1_PORPP|nr:Calcium-binding mitochondrial carrier protein SCaMC-1 [Porphyridium purpureum]|eukprot:POR8019..scf295_1
MAPCLVAVCVSRPARSERQHDRGHIRSDRATRTDLRRSQKLGRRMELAFSNKENAPSADSEKQLAKRANSGRASGSESRVQEREQQQQQHKAGLGFSFNLDVEGIKSSRAYRAATNRNVRILLAGAIAGIVSRTVVSPLEVLATLRMCTVGKAGGTLLAQAREVLKKNGIRGFWSGNLANCLKVAPSRGIQFVTFEAFKKTMHRIKNRSGAGDAAASGTDKPLTASERLLAGGLAGMSAALLCYPLETAKTLLTAHPELYSSVFGTMAGVARTQGLPALYKGLAPTLVAMFPYVGLDLMVYEQLKIIYKRRFGREAGFMDMLVMGSIAGSVAQTVCHPLDVVRKRLQLQGLGGRPVVHHGGFLPTMREIASSEGVSALYRGLAPQYLSVLPSAGVSYLVYEKMKILLGLQSVQ